MAGMHEKDGMAMSVRAGLLETEVVMWEAAGERDMDRTRDARGAYHGRPPLNSLRTSDSHLLRPSQLDAFINSSICRNRSPFCRATGNDGSTFAAACCGYLTFQVRSRENRTRDRMEKRKPSVRTKGMMRTP